MISEQTKVNSIVYLTSFRNFLPLGTDHNNKNPPINWLMGKFWEVWQECSSSEMGITQNQSNKAKSVN